VPGTPQELKTEDMGTRVRAVRELAGLPQREVARAAGMSRRDLQAAERGAKRLSSAELRAVAGALGVDPEVFVGVGNDFDLVRAPVPERSDGTAGHDPERRRDFATRERIEGSWRHVRGEMGDVLTSCARLISAGSGDDVRRLVERLERDLHDLKSKRGFHLTLADHERALQRVRGTGGNLRSSSAMIATTDIG
jgi:transcriptional regulator with XRE-family HTH domain